MKTVFTFLMSIFCFFSSLNASESAFMNISDLIKVLKFADNDYQINVDNDWHSFNSIYTDEQGFCYLQTGRKDKYRDESSASANELACILECPDCGRAQTCGLVAKNKNRCSSCRKIFSASALSWECTRCGTQNYLNPEKCGWPFCNCPRYLCDRDEKNNLNTNS